ncbi:MAG: BamA/TamA family outer membrane protein [Chitinispirillaceae bacterium]
MLFRKKTPFLLLWIFICGLYASEVPDTLGPRIQAVKIHGNETTHPDILELFFTFDTGSVLDTAQLRVTKENLLGTHLFSKVDIFSHIREDGAHVYVVLKEAVRLSLDYGGEYFYYKHGRRDFWWRLRAAGTLNNFRGRMESFTTALSFWDHRSLGFAWYKPLFPGPYYIGAGVHISGYPDDALPMDYLDLFARATLGRKISKHSRISLSTVPTYRRRITDSTKVHQDSTETRIADTAYFYEAYTMLSMVNDFRSSRFDPDKGWFLHSEIRTNHLYSGISSRYMQLSADLRCYLPLFFDDKLSLRFSLVARNADGGSNHRLLYGDAGQIRGYARKALGWPFVANSAVLLSAKYHKPLWTSPPVPVPLLNLVFPGVNEITYRVDGTLIADYAKLHKGPYDVFTFEGPCQSGIGLGAGFRVVIPVLRQSVCGDLVFGRRGTRGSYTWKPVLHGYLDLFY